MKGQIAYAKAGGAGNANRLSDHLPIHARRWLVLIVYRTLSAFKSPLGIFIDVRLIGGGA